MDFTAPFADVIFGRTTYYSEDVKYFKEKIRLGRTPLMTVPSKGNNLRNQISITEIYLNTIRGGFATQSPLHQPQCVSCLMGG